MPRPLAAAVLTVLGGLALPHVALAQQFAIPAIRDLPWDCQPGDGEVLDLPDVANCILEAPEGRSASEIDIGVSLAREMLRRAEEDGLPRTSLDDVRRKLVIDLGYAGRAEQMIEEAIPFAEAAQGDFTQACLTLGRIMTSLARVESGSAAEQFTAHFGLSECPPYVPQQGWGGSLQASFYESWFGNQLRAMEEPALRGDGDLTEYSRRYRMSVHPSFSPSFALRIDQSGDGHSRLAWVMLDGAGGFDPGAVHLRGDRLLNPGEARDLFSALDRANLSGHPMEEPKYQSDEDDRIYVCADGTTWVFEELTRASREFVTRHFCAYRNAEIEALIAETYRLAPPEIASELTF